MKKFFQNKFVQLTGVVATATVVVGTAVCVLTFHGCPTTDSQESVKDTDMSTTESLESSSDDSTTVATTSTGMSEDTSTAADETSPAQTSK